MLGGVIEVSVIFNLVLLGIFSNEKIGGNFGGLVRLIVEMVSRNGRGRY